MTTEATVPSPVNQELTLNEVKDWLFSRGFRPREACALTNGLDRSDRPTWPHMVLGHYYVLFREWLVTGKRQPYIEFYEGGSPASDNPGGYVCMLGVELQHLRILDGHRWYDNACQSQHVCPVAIPYRDPDSKRVECFSNELPDEDCTY